MKIITLTIVLFSTVLFSYAQDTTIWNNENIGKYTIKNPGVYIIKGTVTANITVDPSSDGDVTIEGQGENPILHGIPWGGNTRRHVSHYSGAAKGGTLTWKNLTIKGDGHNAMEGQGNTKKIFENLHVMNFERTEGEKEYDNVGSINGGSNSVIRDCYIETGDDAAKLTEPNSECYNTRIRLTKNGAAIQFGWQDRFGGANHIADSLEIRGQLNPNIKDQTNESDNPGRCIIGGIVQNNGQNISLTKLDIDVTNYKHLIKLVAQNGNTQNPVLNDVHIQGKASDRSIMNVENMKCVSLVAKNNAKLNNVVIDLGDKITETKYHYIKGDVDVKFLRSNGTYVEYINGKLQGSGLINSITSENNYKVFPLPFENNFTVSNVKPGDNIQLISISGEQIPIDINVETLLSVVQPKIELPGGLYLVRIKSVDSVSLIKVIKK